jgi:hypothetical protein
MGHVVSSETSLELLPSDSIDIGVGNVSLPPVCCSYKIAGVPRRELSHGQNTGLSLVSCQLTSASPLLEKR